MNIYSFSILCFSFGVLVIAILSLSRRRDALSIRFFVFSVFVCGWGFPEALWINQIYDSQTTLLLMRISNSFAVFIPITWLHFVFEFIQKKQSRVFYLINYALCVLLVSLAGTDLFIVGLRPLGDFKFYLIPGMVYNIFTLSFFSLVPYGFYYLLQVYKTSSGHAREQLKYFLLGTLIGFSGGSTTFVPLYSSYKEPLILVSLMTFYPFFMGVALIRYGLFDVQEIADTFQREKMAVLGTMSASLNHELRNPLYIAKGKAETYLDAVDRKLQPTNDAAQSSVSSILSQVNRALDIVQRFSDFARPFKKSIPKERVVLREVFQEVQELVSNEFQKGKIVLNNQLYNGLSVMASRRHMEEILSNLVINACHAIGEKEGRVTVAATQVNGKVKLEISDTGAGIPEESQKRIFEPFYSTKGPKGTGLGLYITKQLVERNGGKIAVRSKMGTGTSFGLEFEAAK